MIDSLEDSTLSRHPLLRDLRRLILDASLVGLDGDSTASDQNIALCKPIIDGIQRLVVEIDELQNEWTVDGQYQPSRFLIDAKSALNRTYRLLVVGHAWDALPNMRTAYLELRAFVKASRPSGVDRALKGVRSAGAQKSRLIIGDRTLASWTGEAVFILDGVAASIEAIQAVAVSNIERIEILRGPHAASMYGGEVVIAVTTKKKAPDSRSMRVESSVVNVYDGRAVVLLDGVEVKAEVLNALHPADIERVEILRGPGATRWLAGNPNATGVISVTTKKGAKARKAKQKTTLDKALTRDTSIQSVPAAVTIITSEDLAGLTQIEPVPAAVTVITGKELRSVNVPALKEVFPQYPHATKGALILNRGDGTFENSDEHSAENIERLRQRALYSSPSFASRVEAIRALGELGRKAAAGAWSGKTGIEFGRPSTRVVEILTELIERRQEDPAAQRAAIDALARVKSPGALAAIALAARQHHDVLVRAKAISAYASAADSREAIPLLLQQIQTERSRLVQAAILSSLMAEGERGISALIDIAKRHPNREVRRLAIEFWAELDEDAANAALEALERERR